MRKISILSLSTIVIISLFAAEDTSKAKMTADTNVSKKELMYLEIKPMLPYQYQAVKRVIVECAIELWQLKYTSDELQKQLDAQEEFNDIAQAQTVYFNNKGTFIVLLDNEKVCGSGGIKKLDSETAELVRLYFLKEYRGKGFGLKMAQQLLEFAKSQGYKKVRLSVLHPPSQVAAISLYKKLGFYEIEPYNNKSCKFFMEKIL